MTGIAVVGSHVFGIYMRCERLPKQGETVFGWDFDSPVSGDGGKGSNQAVCCAQFGESVSFIGKVGCDDAGDHCIRSLSDRGINVDHLLRSPDHATGASIALIDVQGHSVIAVDPGANHDIQIEQLWTASPAIARHSIMLTQCELSTSTIRDATRIGRALGLKTIVNPGPAPSDFEKALGHIDAITPNRHEALALLGPHFVEERRPLKTCKSLAAALGIENVIVTLGSEGIVAFCEGTPLVIPALAVRQRNAVGAGDGFSAALAVALAHQFDWEDAIRFASIVGAFVVANDKPPWDAYPNADQLMAFVSPRDRALAQLAAQVLAPQLENSSTTVDRI